jgi:hypothetical protein
LTVDEAGMDQERFEALLAAYGADAARWPPAERAPALRYLAATPSAHALRAAVRRIDGLLDAWRVDSPDARQRDRAAVSAPARQLRRRALWLSSAGLAAACILGVLAGVDIGHASLPAQPTSEREADPAVTAALDGSSEFTPNLDAGVS